MAHQSLQWHRDGWRGDGEAGEKEKQRVFCFAYKFGSYGVPIFVVCFLFLLLSVCLLTLFSSVRGDATRQNMWGTGRWTELGAWCETCKDSIKKFNFFPSWKHIKPTVYLYLSFPTHSPHLNSSSETWRPYVGPENCVRLSDVEGMSTT